jgi:hypothetical protein
LVAYLAFRKSGVRRDQIELVVTIFEGDKEVPRFKEYSSASVD